MYAPTPMLPDGLPLALREPRPTGLEDVGAILARWREYFIYDPKTGDLNLRFILETQPSNTRYRATRYVRQGKGRNVISMDGFTVVSARVVWLLHHGDWPKGRLRRHDGNHLNDRIENLYEAEEEARAPGRPPGRGAIRPKGVSRFQDGWQAYTNESGKLKRIGLFNTESEAAEARRKWDAGERPEPKRSRRIGVTKTQGFWAVWGAHPKDVLGFHPTYSEAVQCREAWEARQAKPDDFSDLV